MNKKKNDRTKKYNGHKTLKSKRYAKTYILKQTFECVIFIVRMDRPFSLFSISDW